MKAPSLKNLWAQADKRAVKIFALASFVLWLFLIAVFYGIAQWVEPELDDFDIALLDPVTAKIPKENTVDSLSPLPEMESTPKLPENLEPHWQAHKKLASLLLEKGEVIAGSEHAKEALSLFGADTGLLRTAAQAFLKAGQMSRALQAARSGLKLDPRNEIFKRVEVLSLHYLGNPSEALALAEEYLKTHPQNLEVLTAAGQIAIEAATPNPGHLKRALKLNPKYGPARYQMARYYKMRGDYKDAKAWLEKYLVEYQGDAKAHAQLGAVHFYLRNPDAAEKEYELALALNPRDYNTWYNWGELHLHRFNGSSSASLQRKLRDDALDCYEKTLLLAPMHPEANYRVGVLLNGNQQYKEAVRHLEVALDHNPRNFRALLQISIAYERLERAQDALTYLNRAYRLDPGNELVLHKLKLLSGHSPS